MMLKFETLYSHDDTLDIDLHYCGYRDSAHPLREGPTIRKAYLIHVVTKGSCYLWCEDKSKGFDAVQHKISAGQCFLIVPDKVYYYGSEGEENTSVFWFSFNGTKAEEYLKTMGLSFESPIMELGHDTIEKLYLRVMRLCELSDSGAEHTEILSELYGAVACFGNEKRKAGMTKANEYVKKATIFIEHNYNSYITVSDIVAYLSLNRSYFTKIFKEQTGLSPKDYLADYRIKKAAELIRTTEFKFNEISKCVGIREEYYFWRLFKRITGYSPTEYRRIANKY